MQVLGEAPPIILASYLRQIGRAQLRFSQWKIPGRMFMGHHKHTVFRWSAIKHHKKTIRKLAYLTWISIEFPWLDFHINSFTKKTIEFQATSGVQGGHDCTIISFEVPLRLQNLFQWRSNLVRSVYNDLSRHLLQGFLRRNTFCWQWQALGWKRYSRYLQLVRLSSRMI